MQERMQPSRKGSVFASGGLVVLLLTVGPSTVFGQTAPPGEAPQAGTPGQGEAAAGASGEAPQPPPPPPPPTPKPEPPPPPPVGPAAPAELPFGTVPKGP